MWHLPFIRALANHRSNGTITLLARRTTHAQALLANDPCITRVDYVPYLSGPFRHLRELFVTMAVLRRLHAQSLWVLDKISRPAIAARLLGVHDVFGFGLGSQQRWVHGATLAQDLRDAHQIDKLVAFFELHDIPVDSTEPGLVIDSSAINDQRIRFEEHPRPWVMLGVGARNHIRRWPHASYCQVIERFDGAGTWFVLGGLDEIDIVDREIVARSTMPNVVNISHLQIAQAAALASSCDLFVGNDSGPMNLAAAVGVPTIGLFGVTAALRYSKHIHPLSSPANDQRMSAITVDEVADLAMRLAVFDKPPYSSP